MIKSLNDLGLYRDKSFSATALAIRKDLERHYWRGLIDGDGSVTIASPNGFKALRVNFLGTKSLVDAFSQFCLQITGFSPKVTQQKASPTTYLCVACGKTALVLLNEIYKNSNIKLDRKYNTYIKALEEIPCLKLKVCYLADYLSENNMSVSDMARKINWKIQNFHMIYNGKRFATKEMIELISKYTHILYKNLVEQEI